jgi:hypothetical protein
MTEERYTLPMNPGRLYTPYDLTMQAWKYRDSMKNAETRAQMDPFTRINIDPYWEYKVSP